MEISGKLQSKLYWDGVLLEKGNKKDFVKIEGDSVEHIISESFSEGFLKGMGVALVGSAYPLLSGSLVSYLSYKDVAAAAIIDMKEKDKEAVRKSALKGALLGGVKGTLHGVLDSMVIGGLTAGAVAVMGPFGVLLAPVIGGVYNVVKDAIRT